MVKAVKILEKLGRKVKWIASHKGSKVNDIFVASLNNS